MNKKIISTILMATIVSSTLVTTLTTPTKASTSYTNQSLKGSVVNSTSTQNLINDVQKYVVVHDDGTIGLSSSVPNELYDKYELDMLEARFTELNAQVKANKIVINNDLTIQKTYHINSLLEHDDDYRSEFWWGVSIGYCGQCAKDVAYEASNGASFLGLFGYIGGGIGAGLPASWFNKFANDINYYRTDNGVVVDLNYTLSYNMYGR